MKKNISKLFIVTLILVFLGIITVNKINAAKTRDNHNLKSLKQIQEIANVEEKAIPSHLTDLNVWKEETKDLMETKYELPVVDIIDTQTSVTFVFEEVPPKNAENGVSYPTTVEYNKISSQTDADDSSTLLENQTKYVTVTTYSEPVLKNKSTISGNKIESDSSSINYEEVDVYTQTKTTNKSGQVGVVAWDGSVAWKPTYIIEKYDYFTYTLGRIHYSDKPAVGYSTETQWYDSFTNDAFDSSAALYQSKALFYFGNGETYINGKIYKM